MVAGEHFVSALPRLHDLHVLGHFLAEQIEGDTVVADHRFAHRPDRAVQRGQHPLGFDADLVMIGLEALGHDVGVLELVALDVAGGLEPDGEGRQPVLPGLGEQADDQARVDATGKQAADRNVRDQSALDCGPQRGQHGVFPVAFGPAGAVLVPGEVGRPVGGGDATPVGFDGEQRSRRDLAHAAQDGGRCGHHGVKRHVVVQGDAVDAGVHATAGQQRRQRRRKPDSVTVLGHVQRLDAEAIAAEQHPTAVALDDGEGEHAFEVADEIVTPAVVGLEQNLAVAVREESVAVALKLAAQFLVVVDAAVPGNCQAEVGIDHRLRAGFGQIDDFQTTMTKRDSTL